MRNSDTAFGHLTREQQLHLLTKVKHTWKELNKQFFFGSLKQPAFGLKHSKTQWASYHPHHGIHIHPELVAKGDWVHDVIPVLKHEMAHQYIAELIDPDHSQHDALFRQVCNRIGAHPGASINLKDWGSEGQAETSETGSRRNTEAHDLAILRKVEKLLNLSQSDNIHEAEVAMAQAHRLILKHNLDPTRTSERDYTRKDISLGKKRCSSPMSFMIGLLQDFYGVDIVFFHDWDEEGRYSAQFALLGKRPAVVVAEYVYHYLSRLGEHLWQEHKAGLSASYQSETNHARAKRAKPAAKAGHTLRQRNSFLIGLWSGLREKLMHEQSRLAETGLIWKADPELLEFSRNHFPNTRSQRSSSPALGSSYLTGKEQGKDITIRKGVDASGTSAAIRLAGKTQQRPRLNAPTT